MLKDLMDIPSFYTDEVAALDFFKQYGFHAEYNFIDHHRCAELIAASQTLPNAKNGEYRTTLNPHVDNPQFLHVMRDPKLIKLIEKLVGGKVSGIQTQLFFGKPGTTGFSIHQDNFFVEAEPANHFVSTWLALNDVNIENGTIYIYPGAHQEGLLPVRKLIAVENVGQEYNAANEECMVPSKYQAVPVEVPKGTIIFIHSLLPHGSYRNQSKDAWRYVMLNNYIQQNTPFRAGNSAKRKEIPVYF